MSPNVSSFVHDLVEMAQATQRLPELESAVHDLNEKLNRAMDTIAEREQSILKLKAEFDSLHESLRQAEVARDHAETMFLEADDRADKALAFVRTLRGNVESMLSAFEPVVPQPEPAPAPTPSMAMEISEQVPAGVSEEPKAPANPVTNAEVAADPNPTPVSASTDGSTPTQAPPSETGSGYASAEEVASEARPTSLVSGIGTSGDTPAQPAKEPAPFYQPEPTPNYAGKLYFRIHGWVSRNDWLRFGGSDATYDWREGDPLPEGVSA